MDTGHQLCLPFEIPHSQSLQAEDADNSNTNRHIDSLQAGIGTDELRSMTIFCAPNPETQGRMQKKVQKVVGGKIYRLDEVPNMLEQIYYESLEISNISSIAVMYNN